MESKEKTEVLLTLKIGRYEYDITERDTFLDNGACIQLLTQAKQFKGWGYITPVLSKRAVEEISAFLRMPKPHKYKGGSVTVFSIAKI